MFWYVTHQITSKDENISQAVKKNTVISSDIVADEWMQDHQLTPILPLTLFTHPTRHA